MCVYIVPAYAAAVPTHELVQRATHELVQRAGGGLTILPAQEYDLWRIGHLFASHHIYIWFLYFMLCRKHPFLPPSPQIGQLEIVAQLKNGVRRPATHLSDVSVHLVCATGRMLTGTV